MARTASRASRKGTCSGFFNLENPTVLYYVILAGFLLGFLLIFRTINSPFGEVLKSIRENEQRAISLGYKTDHYKLLAFILSGTLGGFAGALKVFVAQNASLTDVEVEHVRADRADDAGRRSRHGVRSGGGRLHHCRHAAIFVRVRAMGDGDPGRDLRGLRADVPPRDHRRNRALSSAGRSRRSDFRRFRGRYKAVDDRFPGLDRGAFPSNRL